jgi:hypothetical protein
MKRLFGNQLSPMPNIRRIEMLYGRLPSGIVSALIGIFLCFVVLFDSVNLDLLKAWTAYMLSVIADAGLDLVHVQQGRPMAQADHAALGMVVRRRRPAHRPRLGGAVRTALSAGDASRGADVRRADGGDHGLHRLGVCRGEQCHLLAVHRPRCWGPPSCTYTAHPRLPARSGRSPPLRCCIAVFVIVQRTLYRSAASNARPQHAKPKPCSPNSRRSSIPRRWGIAVLDGSHIRSSATCAWANCSGRRIQDLAGSQAWTITSSASDEAGQFLVE